MAKSNNYYGDADEQDESGKDKGSGGASATLPKSLLMGKSFEVGDEVVLKITAVHDDQVVVKYASDEPAAEEKPEEAAETPPETPAEEPAMVGEEAPPEGGSLYD